MNLPKVCKNCFLYKLDSNSSRLLLAWQEHHPPNSIPTDITPPQFVSIQEKGVSAFEFEWEPEANVFVAGRTEVQFMEGENCVQTNLPLPRNQEVYYWEVNRLIYYVIRIYNSHSMIRPRCLINPKLLLSRLV
jgi:hypothetical protein